MSIELPFPAKILWPNGRGHWGKRHSAFKAHKNWAYRATKATLPPCFHPALEKRIRWSATFYPKTAHKIDADNAVSSLKAYQDGIALALGVNDNLFDQPVIRFAEPVKNGRVVIVIGEGE